MNSSYTEMDEEYVSFKYNETYPYTFEIRDPYKFIMRCILLNIIILFGIILNVMSIIILSRMRSIINILLISLAYSNTLLIIMTSLLYGLLNIYMESDYMSNYALSIYPRTLPYAEPTWHIAQTLTLYLMVLLSFERYIVMYHPLRMRTLCSYNRMKICIILIIVFALVFNLPHFWRYTYAYNACLSIIHKTNVYMILRPNIDPVFMDIYWKMCFVFIYLVPFTSLAILNMLIFRKVWRKNADRQKLSLQQCYEISFAIMQLWMVLIFFLCYVVVFVIYMTSDGSADFYMTDSFQILVINSSVNFVIYVIFFEKFRQLFLRMFCCRKSANFLDMQPPLIDLSGVVLENDPMREP